MVGRYQAYKEYRDVGPEWQGKTPKDWDVVRIGSVFSERRETVSDIDWPALSVTMQGIVPQLDTAAKSDAGDNRKKVVTGDFVINSRSDRKGSSGVSPFDGSVSLISIVLTPNRIDPAFVHHLFRSQVFQEEFYRNGKGIVADLWSTKYSEMKNILFALPSAQEQKNIAAFLDYETARIDALIAKQERLIELLKEKRQAVISHAVTKGLDETSSLLSHFVDLLPGYAFKSENFLESPDGPALLRGINVGVNCIRWEAAVYIGGDDVEIARFLLKEGDLVIGMDRPWIASGARVAVIERKDLPCYLVQRVARVTARNGLHHDYLRILLMSREFQAYVESDLTGVSVPHLSPEQIKSFRIPVLAMEEQLKRVREVKKVEHSVALLEEKSNAAIQLMKERRSALISAVVTGKIDVRNWAPPANANATTDSAEPITA